GVAADVEVVAVAIDGLRELGLGVEDFRARVSDRRVLRGLLLSLGVAEDALPAAFAVIDKLERMPRDKAEGLLSEGTGLDAAAAGRVLEAVSTATPESLEEALADQPDGPENVQRLREYVEALDAMGLGGFVELDLGIVRGLAYYTGIVFELFDRQGELRAICGGGRYDHLLELVGGEPLPAVGFGMGDVVLGELLAERKLVPEFASALDYFIVTVSSEQRPEALRLAHGLRDKGHSVAYALRDQGMGKQMKSAAKDGAREVLIMGPDELARGCVVARDMESGTEREIELADLT
ncbi:MAG: ATP phosphoribosyltransferase regulatory subunit, partial [Gemmatimonadota bacterium]